MGSYALLFRSFSSLISFQEQLWKLACFEWETSCVFEIPQVPNLVISAHVTIKNLAGFFVLLPGFPVLKIS